MSVFLPSRGSALGTHNGGSTKDTLPTQGLEDISYHDTKHRGTHNGGGTKEAFLKTRRTSSMTSRAALTVIRHGATLASGLMRSGSYMKPARAENGEKFAMNLTQLRVHTIRCVELNPNDYCFVP